MKIILKIVGLTSVVGIVIGLIGFTMKGTLGENWNTITIATSSILGGFIGIQVIRMERLKEEAAELNRISHDIRELLKELNIHE